MAFSRWTAVPSFLIAAVVGFSIAACTHTAPPETVAAQPAVAPPPPPPDKLAAPKLDFEKYKLANGLEVILVEDHRLPLVAVNLWYHVGPANERPGRTGFAHLFEHMMFQGSKNVPDDAHIKLLEGAGAADLNGTTDFDRTNYFETLPSNQLELALWLESDRMGFLLDTLDQAKLSNQRDVVRNERRQSVENKPYGLAEEEMFHQLFPKGHPYYASVIGSHADIEAVRLNDVRDFFKQYYVPNNASLAIVGDISKTEARALVEKYFGPIPAGAPIPKIDVQTPPITAEKRATVHDKIELPRVYMAWITPSIFKPGDAEADLLANILGGGKSSRLYKALVYDKKIAQDVTASQYSLVLGSVFSIEATAKPGVKPEELEKAIDGELAALRQEGPTDEEVQRARNTIDSQIIRGLETLGGFGGVADRLNQYNHYLGDPGYLPQDLARYNRASAASIQKLAQTSLADNSRVILYAEPGDKVVEDVARSTDEKPETTARTLPAPVKDWRAEPPAAGPASKLSLPSPQRSQLANGLTVYLLEQHNLPIVSANLVVLSGSEQNPNTKPGLAAFTADMLDEGTQKRPALQIAKDVAQIGATLSTGSSSDSSSIAVRTLKTNVDEAFDLLSDVTLNPAFAPNEIERIRNDRLTQLRQQRDNPNAIASRVFAQVVYGDKHPYGFIELGTSDSLKTLSRDDLVSFWKTGYVPRNAALIVAGDLTSAELQALAEKYFGQWTGEATKAVTPAVEQKAQRRVVLVDRGKSPQTALRIGEIGVPRANPDYVSIEVMNTALGGLFSSRINMNLREKNGYTYGAGSQFAFRRGPGPFVVGTGVRTDVTAPAVKEIFIELKRMRTEPLSVEELSLSKDSFERSLPGLFETTPQSAATIGQLFVYNLPLDYYSTLPAKIQSVTAGEVQRVAAQYLTPEKMVVVAVGDKSNIEAGLKKLKLGPVESRSVD
jgi:zinc protease